MESKYFSLPEERNYEHGYKLAYKLASEQLLEIHEIAQHCQKSGSQYEIIDSQGTITLSYLNQTYQITLPDINISLLHSKDTIPFREKILMLHYFIQARGTANTNKIIAFRELPEGANYFPTFFKRAIKPLIEHFGKEPEKLLTAANKMSGNKAAYGDISVTINAFRYVPITFVLWLGDEELDPGGNILFDSTITDYLSTEDINVLCETIIWKLVKYLKNI
ncbi:MAG: DUF3786 domain-containing protein [Dehalococcoidales bacterium]|nr:DUF3786 domain-containing protein [Dehalococcoidales bacterium]